MDGMFGVDSSAGGSRWATVPAGSTAWDGASPEPQEAPGQTVLILSFSDLARDPRVNRQIRFLRESYRVITAGLAPSQLPGVDHVPLAYRGKTTAGKALSIVQLVSGDYEGYYWRQRHVIDALIKLSTVRPDLVLANDIDALPLALRLASGAPVIFDAHEYAPEEWSDLLLFRVFFQRYRLHLCRRYMPQVEAAMTVCSSIAEAYERNTGVRPVVVTNAPDYEELEPLARPPEDPRIRLVHHGIAARSRRIEQMIRMMDHLDERFELDLLLTGSGNVQGYLDELKGLASGKRVRFRDPVPMRALPRVLNRYDVGVFLLAPVNFNYRFALPNKLFEFIQARLAISIGPSPEMARVVREHDCGVVAADFTPEAMAESLRGLDRERILHYKRRSHAIAREMSAEPNRERILGLVEAAIGR